MRMSLRKDLSLIAGLVAAGSSVLDVGCGNGELLAWLEANKRVRSRGIELSQAGVNEAIARGLSVIHGDANEDLSFYPDGMVDYVILSQTLQTLKAPHEVLAQLVRIGKVAIVSVPNFGHWRNRLYFGLKGRMPVTKMLSYEWYDTPNIHFCTIRDFEALCGQLGLEIVQKLYVNLRGDRKNPLKWDLLANLFSEQGIFMIRKT